MVSTEVLTLDIAKIELVNPNEETVKTPTSSHSEEDRVLIEKDGKFELIKAGDIHASPLDSIIMPLESDPGDNIVKTLKQPDHLQTESKPKNKILSVKDSPASSRNNLTSKPTASGRKLASRTPPPQGLGTAGSASSLTQSRRRPRPNTQPFTPGSSPPRRDVRPRTAPLGSNSSSYYSLKGAERRELAEEAFGAWLDLKDKQLSEGSRGGAANTPDTDPDKVKRTANAYQAWMDNKRKQVLSELGLKERKESNKTGQDRPSDKVTFERWLRGKSQFKKRKSPK